jgi:hypothetical protein
MQGAYMQSTKVSFIAIPGRCGVTYRHVDWPTAFIKHDIVHLFFFFLDKMWLSTMKETTLTRMIFQVMQHRQLERGVMELLTTFFPFFFARTPFSNLLFFKPRRLAVILKAYAICPLSHFSFAFFQLFYFFFVHSNKHTNNKH